MDDQSIKNYINDYYEETELKHREDIHLSALKFLYEKNPTEQNDKNWLQYSNQVCLRRSKKLITIEPNGEK